MKIILLAVLAGCGGPQGAPEVQNRSEAPPDATAPLRQDVTCGQDTCGADEYCENRCLCCGMSADPAQLKGTSACLPLPDVCRDANPPECQQRTVDIPCA